MEDAIKLITLGGHSWSGVLLQMVNSFGSLDGSINRERVLPL